MKVTTVNTIEQFDELKTSWDTVYAADENASVFVSWDFMRGWIAGNKNNWMALAARSDDLEDYRAFLFLIKNKNGRVLTTCDSAIVDRSSFICSPENEKDTIRGFANFIQEQLTWEKLEFLEVMDPRLDYLLECFSQKKYFIRELERTVCPYIPLGNTWDEYLLKRLSQKARKKLRKYLRGIEDQNEFHVTDIQSGDVEKSIETLLQLWQIKWGDVSTARLENLRSIFQYCFKNNHLFMPILWSGDKPVSASVSFVDYEKKCLYDYIGGWDDEFSKLSPGTTLNAYGIRFATENGFNIYDFLRGDEGYKYSAFGAKERYNRNVVIENKSLKSTTRKLKKRFRKYFT